MKSSPRAARLYLAGVAVLGLAFLVFAQAAFDLVPFGGALVSPTFPDHIVLLYVLSTFVFLILTVFAFILARSLFKLLMERRMGRPGARFKTRLVMSMTALTLLPAFFLFAFAFGLVNRSIDKWFSVPADSFFRTTTEIQTVWAAEHRTTAEGILRELARAVPDDLGRARANLNLDAIAIVRPDGTVLASAVDGEGSRGVVEALAQRAGGIRSAPDPLLAETGDGLEGIVGLPGGYGEEDALLVARFHPDERFESLARTMASDSQTYRTLREDQLWYRDLYVYILVLMTVLLLFAAVWTGLFLSKKITVPIEALSVATREISSGNLDHRVEVDAEDELESLVGLFNDMAGKLQHTTAELDRRRRYTDTVLEAVPTGVISIDDRYRVTRINRAARTMFSVDHAESLAEIFSREDLETIGELLRVCVQEGTTTRELRLETERNAPGSPGGGIQSAVIANRLSTGGFVLVIEDLTDVVKAQKATAWREVARQLAHEIKNPLTPIQLSAERISRNLERVSHPAAQPPGQSGSLDRRTADVIRECVDSIVSEVEGLKSLVNEFGRVARLPTIAQKPEEIHDLVGRTLALYEGRLDDVEVGVDIPPDLPAVLMDGRQIKRVLINLIDNALEAMQDRPAKRLGITCSLVRGRTMARLAVTDSGHGIAPEDRERLFAPYFSTRKDGTGLGLAIASRIVVDHGGYIGAESNGGGARFIVDLPLWRES